MRWIVPLVVPVGPLVAGALIACTPSRVVKVTPKPGEPKLDIVAPWVDPAGYWPRGTPPPVRPLADALADPGTPPIVIRGATILTAAGRRIDQGTVVIDKGTLRAIGEEPAEAPAGAIEIDGRGKFVTPGIIDAHSHIGVYSAPSARAHSDGNEAVAPTTAYARAEYGYWPQDPQIPRALAGGVTTALILPGSANLIGGRGFTVTMRPARTASEAAFPGAPSTVKMACGENPKRVYGDKGGPKTRMAEYAVFRTAFVEAANYAAKRAAYVKQRDQWLDKRMRAAELDGKHGDRRRRIPGETAPEPPPIDLKLETLAGVLRGDVLVQVHCYRADEMANMLAIADEMGFRIRSFHHALEAYKIRDLLAANDVAINTWADWWGFKLEAYDGIPENAALITEQGGRATIHSDSAIGIQRLNQEAAKAQAAGQRAGIAIDDDTALRWITANPAWVLGIDTVTGTLEVGKRADVVVWSGSPFSVYSRADVVIVGGDIAYARSAGMRASDYELGHGVIDRGVVEHGAGGK
jgi:imidazolonepropionase-like amidohydrolase